MKTYSAYEIADIIHGKLFAEKDIKIKGISAPENAGEGDIVCFHSANGFNDKLPNASLFVIDEKYSFDLKPCIKVKNTKKAFIKLLNLFDPFRETISKAFISNTANIHSSAKIGKNCSIYHNVSIMQDVTIGDNCKLYPNVYIGDKVRIGNNVTLKPCVIIEAGVTIGNNVIINSGTVIGTDGFGYFDFQGKKEKIPQIGGVIIEDNVEIGANVCIDRATLSNTIIKEGTKIDNLVQIGHNSIVGKNCILVSQAGISGSCNIGNNCIIAGQAGISDHVELGDNSIVMSKSGVSKSFQEKNSMLFGIPAKDARKTKRIIASMNKLPELIKKVNKIEKSLQNYKTNQGE